MTAPDLLPCPFCGETQPPHDDTSWVRCLNCGAETGWQATGAEAIAAWNRRAAIPARGVGVKQGGCPFSFDEEDCCGGYCGMDEQHTGRPPALAPTDAAQAREAALREAHKAILEMDTFKDKDRSYNLAIHRAAAKIKAMINNEQR